MDWSDIDIRNHITKNSEHRTNWLLTIWDIANTLHDIEILDNSNKEFIVYSALNEENEFVMYAISKRRKIPDVVIVCDEEKIDDYMNIDTAASRKDAKIKAAELLRLLIVKHRYKFVGHCFSVGGQKMFDRLEKDPMIKLLVWSSKVYIERKENGI